MNVLCPFFTCSCDQNSQLVMLLLMLTLVNASYSICAQIYR